MKQIQKLEEFDGYRVFFTDGSADEWGHPRTRLRSWAVTEAVQIAKAAAAVTGKGMNHGKGGRRWSQVAIYNSDYAPYPFDLDFLIVDAAHFVWDEMCDKFRKEQEKVGNYQLATVQGKPPKGAGADQTATASAMAPPATITPKAKAGKGTGGGRKSA